jgi:hypothetical protein
MPVEKWTRQGWQLDERRPTPLPIKKPRKEALMPTRRPPRHGPIGAVLFATALFLLAGVFINDWYETHFPRVAIAKVVPPSPPAESALVVAVPREEPKPAEPAPAVEEKEEPPAVAYDDIPKEDPWAEEKERLQHKRGRGAVIVNPRVIINGNAIALGDMQVFRPQIVVPQFREFAIPDARAFAMPQMIDPEKFAEDFFADVTARHVAAAAQAMILSEIPESRHFVAKFDVAPKDGRLVVTVRDAFLSFNDDQRRTVMDGIAQLWRDSKYTKQGCSQKVEFRSNDGWRETVE